jgi:hypothetical protein
MANGYLGTLWNMWMFGIINKVDIGKAVALYGYNLVELTDKNLLVKNETESFEFQYGVKYN